jgi:hypothetical protein
MPAYTALAQMLPPLEELTLLIEQNKETWSSMIPEYEERTEVEKIKLE